MFLKKIFCLKYQNLFVIWHLEWNIFFQNIHRILFIITLKLSIHILIFDKFYDMENTFFLFNNKMIHFAETLWRRFVNSFLSRNAISMMNGQQFFKTVFGIINISYKLQLIAQNFAILLTFSFWNASTIN